MSTSVKNVATSSRYNWLVYFVVYSAIILFQIFFLDYQSSLLGAPRPGWDVRAYCVGVKEHADGLNPYYVRNLEDTSLVYPYLPVTLDLLRPLCSGGFLTLYFREIYLILAAFSAFLLSTFSFSGHRLRDACLKALYIFGGFAGFGWTFLSGNFVILSGMMIALSLYFLYRGFSLQQSNDRDSASKVFYSLGAVTFGLAMSIKIIFFPVLCSLYLLPLIRSKKTSLIIAGGASFFTPILISLLFYHELFFSWLNAVSGQIPQQISPATERSSSLFFIGKAVASNFGIVDSMLLDAFLYAVAISAILLPLAFSLVRIIKNERVDDSRSFLKELDGFLIVNPGFAMRVATLTMVALYLCAPRLKEYAFYELAIYAAVLVVDLPFKTLRIVLAVAIVFPIVAKAPQMPQFIDHFGQTIAAVFCYAVFLLDLYPAFLRFKGQFINQSRE